MTHTTPAPLRAALERIDQLARLVAHDLQGRVEAGKVAAVLQCADVARAALAAAPQPAMREETDLEHMARDMREGRFPGRSPRQQVHVEDALHPIPDREALVEVIEDALYSHSDERGWELTGTAQSIADALLARGMRLPV